MIVLKIDGKFEGKLTCAFKNGMKNLANSRSQAESKNGKYGGTKSKKKLKQPDQPDAV